MRQRLFRLASSATLATLVLVTSGFRLAPAVPADGTVPRGVTGHVIVISIDGLRPDAIAGAGAQVLERMLREGAGSLTARTILPSKTLPSHTSMLTGVPPEVHGITWNTDQTDAHGYVQAETVFELAKRAGYGTAAFFSKDKLRHLAKPGSLDHWQAPRGLSVYGADETVEAAVRYMRFRKPGLMFVHVAEPDAAGHSVGWMSAGYRWAVRRADAAVGQILRAADATYGAGNYTVIVTADHGGTGRDHGEDTNEDVQIPWIAWGAGVQPGPLTGDISTMDTATTVLWLLGVPEPIAWAGRQVAAAYTRAAQITAQAAVN